MTNGLANQIIGFCAAFVNLKEEDAKQYSEKFIHSAQLTLEGTEAFIKAYGKKLNAINLQFASVDEKTRHLIRDQHKEFVYTRENATARLEALEKLDEEEYLYPFEVITTEETKGLTRAEIMLGKKIGFIQ